MGNLKSTAILFILLLVFLVSCDVMGPLSADILAVSLDSVKKTIVSGEKVTVYASPNINSDEISYSWLVDDAPQTDYRTYKFEKALVVDGDTDCIISVQASYKGQVVEQNITIQVKARNQSEIDSTIRISYPLEGMTTTNYIPLQYDFDTKRTYGFIKKYFLNNVEIEQPRIFENLSAGDKKFTIEVTNSGTGEIIRKSVVFTVLDSNISFAKKATVRIINKSTAEIQLLSGSYRVNPADSVLRSYSARIPSWSDGSDTLEIPAEEVINLWYSYENGGVIGFVPLSDNNVTRSLLLEDNASYELTITNSSMVFKKIWQEEDYILRPVLQDVSTASHSMVLDSGNLCYTGSAEPTLYGVIKVQNTSGTTSYESVSAVINFLDENDTLLHTGISNLYSQVKEINSTSFKYNSINPGGTGYLLLRERFTSSVITGLVKKVSVYFVIKGSVPGSFTPPTGVTLTSAAVKGSSGFTFSVQNSSARQVTDNFSVLLGKNSSGEYLGWTYLEYPVDSVLTAGESHTLIDTINSELFPFMQSAEVLFDYRF